MQKAKNIISLTSGASVLNAVWDYTGLDPYERLALSFMSTRMDFRGDYREAVGMPSSLLALKTGMSRSKGKMVLASLLLKGVIDKAATPRSHSSQFSFSESFLSLQSTGKANGRCLNAVWSNATDVGPMATLLCVYLSTRCDFRGDFRSAGVHSLDRLTGATGMSRYTALQAARELEAKKLIVRNRRKDAACHNLPSAYFLGEELFQRYYTMRLAQIAPEPQVVLTPEAKVAQKDAPAAGLPHVEKAGHIATLGVVTLLPWGGHITNSIIPLQDPSSKSLLLRQKAQKEKNSRQFFMERRRARTMGEEIFGMATGYRFASLTPAIDRAVASYGFDTFEEFYNIQVRNNELYSRTTFDAKRLMKCLEQLRDKMKTDAKKHGKGLSSGRRRPAIQHSRIEAA